MLLSPADHSKIYEEEARIEGRTYHQLIRRRAIDLLGEDIIFPVLIKDSEQAILRFRNTRLIREDWSYSLQALSRKHGRWKDWADLPLSHFLKIGEPFEELVLTGKRRTTSTEGIDEIHLSEVSLSFLRQLQPDQMLILFPVRPPLGYLYNLSTYVKNTQIDPVLGIRDSSLSWRPQLLEGNPHTEVIERLENAEMPIIVQGPPGTGKTHMAAEIIAHFQAKGLKICATSLTHRALMELSLKPALGKALGQGKVLKKGLSTSESIENSSLVIYDKVSKTISSGDILLVTYYSLSDWANAMPHPRPYDLLIIEEASQAFLATISLFVRLAKRVLIIGDQKQLQPIFKHQNLAFRHLDAYQKEAGISALQGLNTLANNGDVMGMQLTRCYRLGPRATEITGLFYDGSLLSVQDPLIRDREIAIPPELNSLKKLGDGPILVQVQESYNLLEWVIRQAFILISSNPECTLAILLPTVVEVKQAQKEAAKHRQLSRVRIETVDRMQGATVDFTIFVLGKRAGAFSQEPERINVATSRARHFTWVVTQGQDYVRKFTGGVVGQFWAKIQE